MRVTCIAIVCAISWACAVYAFEDEPVRVSGTVVDNETGLGIPDAIVRATGSVELRSVDRTVQTDESGAFILMLPSGGRYSVAASAVGYSVEAATGRVEVNMAGRDETEGASKLLLKRHATITGKIIDADVGSPLSAVSVIARRATFLRGQRQLWFEGQFHQTDEGGHFEMSGLVPGEYFIEIDPRPTYRGATSAGAVRGDGLNYPRVRWPGTGDSTYSIPVTIPGGVVTDVGDISLKAIELPSLSVTPTGEGCLEGEIVEITLSQTELNSRSPRGNGAVVCGKSHRFVAVTSGRYEVLAKSLSENREKGAVGGTIIEIANGDSSIDVVMARPFPVQGKIQFAEDLPEDVRKMVLSGLSIRLWPRGTISNAAISMVPALPPVATAPDGRFTASVYPPPGDLVDVVLSGLPSQYFVKGLEYNSVAAKPARFSLNLAAINHELTVVLSGRAASIEGKVHDRQGRSVGGAKVLLVPWPVAEGVPYPVDLKEVTADESGAYRFMDLPPGEYRIVSASRVRRSSLEEPGRLLALLASVNGVTVSESTVVNFSSTLEQ